MRIVDIEKMLNYDSTVQYNQDYYDDDKKEEQEEKIAGLDLPAAMDITKFIKDDNDKVIISITPLSIYKEKKSYRDFIKLSFLCKNANGKLFILTTLYDSCFSGDDVIEEFIKNNISFYEEKDYVDNKSKGLLYDMLHKSLPSFYTNLVTKFDNDKTFSITAVIGDGYFKDTVEFNFDTPILNVLKFTDVYIRDCVINNHDIVLCNLHGEKDTKMDLVKIKCVKDVVGIASLKEGSNSFDLALKLEDVDGNDVFIIFIVTVRDESKEKIEKMVNKNLDEFANMYQNNSDYWLTEFYYTTQIDDSSCLIHTARNKDKDNKAFIFNEEAMKDIINLII